MRIRLLSTINQANLMMRLLAAPAPHYGYVQFQFQQSTIKEGRAGPTLLWPIAELMSNKKLLVFSLLSMNHLKGQSHKIFDPRFFSSINTYGPPDLWVKAVSNINSYSQKYSIMNIDSALCRIARSRF
jgi:hypothetical protein